MESSTKILRRMLDERGVEYDKGATVISGIVATVWHDRDGYPCSAIEGADDIPDGEVSFQACVTPEQAIAATLGQGTCQDLGGTGANDEQVFNCSECGCVLSLYDRDGSNNLCTSFIFDYPRYCPECGRRIVQ